MSRPFVFVRETSDIFFSISGSLLYPSFYLFWMWLLFMLWCGLTITHFFISSPSTIFIFYFIPPFHPTSSYLILFSYCFMFDLGLASALHAWLFDVTIHLSSLFVWGLLGLGLMTFSTRCISCMRGMGDYIIGVFEPSFLSFLSPYYLSLRYVPSLKTTLRPWLHTLCLTAHTWAILEISRRLFLGAWWMWSWDDDLHWAIPLLSLMDFQRRHYLHWGISHPPSLMTFSFGMMLCTEA